MDFPAFNNVTFPSAAALGITPIATQNINSDTTFQWTGVISSEPFSFVEIDISFDNGLDIFCIASDDGSFSFPEDVRAQIGGSSASFVDFQRSAVRTVTIGDATLFLSHTVLE